MTTDDEAMEGEPPAGRDPVRRFTLVVAAAVAALLLWYVTADRLAPWTDQARKRESMRKDWSEPGKSRNS